MSPAPAPTQPLPGRLQSLDVFRGATVALMILVNNPGDWNKTYAPLLHAPWHGCTPTDLVFPFFLFIVGVAIPFALAPRILADRPGDGDDPLQVQEGAGGGNPLQNHGGAGGGNPLQNHGGAGGGNPLQNRFSPLSVRGEGGRGERSAPPSSGLRWKIVRRAAILFGLGMLGTLFPFYTVVLERLRIPGVLQRIAVVYLCAAFVYLYLSPKARAFLAAGLLGGYWALMKLVPVPGFPTGDLSPAGNFAFWLDHQLLGAHTWRYAPGPGDPEGILSTLPAIVTALFGIFCGELLRGSLPAGAKLKRLFGWGAAATAAGLLLAPFFPLNKNLWSPTYVLFTTGLALFCLALTWYLVDLKRIDSLSRPFAIFGRNAILAFVGSGLLAKTLLVVCRWQDGQKTVNLQGWLYQSFYAMALPDYVASLAWALTIVLIWLAILTLLDRRGIYLKV